MVSHYLFEIKDTGELIVAPVPLVNGVSMGEHVHFWGTEAGCLEHKESLIAKRKGRRRRRKQ